MFSNELPILKLSVILLVEIRGVKPSLGRGEEQYIERTHLNIREERLLEDDGVGVLLMDVWPDMDAYFLLGLYHPMEIHIAWGDMYPHPSVYGKEMEYPLLAKELRRSGWEVVTHRHWMSRGPLSILTDVAIMNEHATIRCRRNLTTHRVNPTVQYHNKQVGPVGRA